MSRSLPALSLLLLGCPKGPDDTAPDSGDTAPVDACTIGELAEGDFLVDPDGPTTQIHPSAAWDGEGVWVAHGRPEPSSAYFDVWATRVSTVGETLVAPFQLDGGDGASETYARVAYDGSWVVVAWQSDDRSSPYNLDLELRRFRADGSELGDAPVVIEPEVEGTPQQGNGWMPALAADPAGGFALGGAWGLDAVGTFQAVLQPLTSDGLAAGEALVPELDGEQSHYYPSVAVGPAGERLMTWEAWTIAGTEIHVALDGTLTSFADHDDAGLPFVSWERANDGLPYLAWHSVHGGEYDIALAGGDLVEAPVLTTLGQAGRIDHTPIVAAGQHGAVVAWMRNISGLSNELILQPVRLEGDSWTVGDERVLTTETAVAPYLPGLTWLCGDAWFVTWIEGANPDYVVKGRFLRFEGFGA